MCGKLKFIMAFVGGAVAGAGVALLFAPQKGEDLRAQIKEMLKKKGMCNCDARVEEIVEELNVKS
ncbi:MAG: YtxH domain-containing protein [Muribaculaceae bacterium]|nr:YtxH domain-containing protein [Muribaculaceae bacterium]MBR6639033.1 YtxH domain-containing protein [Muribaculaceae bacterium]